MVRASGKSRMGQFPQATQDFQPDRSWTFCSVLFMQVLMYSASAQKDSLNMFMEMLTLEMFYLTNACNVMNA